MIQNKKNSMLERTRLLLQAHRAQFLVALGLLIAALVIDGIWKSGWFSPSTDSADIAVSGNIEAHQSILSVSQVQAPIVYLPFDEGAYVASGTVLARIDDRLYRQQVEIDRSDLQVDLAQVQANESTLDAAQHAVVSDQFDFAEKKIDYARAEVLAQNQAGSLQTRDLAFTAQQQSGASLAHDRALVAVAVNNIKLARATLAAADAKLKLDQVTLSYTVLTAPFNGVLSVREAELGQLAGPGVAVFTIDELDHVWLRAYVNEPDIGRVRLSEAVQVSTDTYPGKIYRGRISFISPQAEFTPKTVETHAERVTLVYRIRIDIDNPTHELLPGMPADAQITKLAAGK